MSGTKIAATPIRTKTVSIAILWVLERWGIIRRSQDNSDSKLRLTVVYQSVATSSYTSYYSSLEVA